MAEPVKFEFELLDRFSGIADRMTGALDRLQKAEDKAQKKTALLDVEIGKLSALGGSADLDKLSKLFIGGAAAGAFTFGIAEGVGVLVDGLGAAVDLVERMVSAAVEFTAEWIKAGAESEKLTKSQNLLLGETQGGALRDYLSGISIGGYDDDAIARALQPILVAGRIRGQLLKDVVAAAGDAEALTAGGTKLDAALGIFQRVEASGKIGARSIEALGLSTAEVFGRLGEVLGTSPEAAAKRAASGSLAPETIMSALFASIAERTPRGLGSAGRDLADTVDAKLERIKNLPGNYLKAIASTAGYASFSGFLDRILEKFDPDSPTGQRILAGLETLANKILSLFDGLTDTDLDGAIATMVELGEAAIDMLPALKGLAEGIVDAVKAVLQVFEGARRAGFGLANLATSGLWGQVMGPPPEVSAARAKWLTTGGLLGREVGQGVVEGTKEKLQIRSPSKVFEDLGEQAGEGFALGVPRGAGDTGAALVPTAPTLAGGGSRTITITIGDVLVSGGTPAEQAQELSREIQRQLRGELAAFFDHELEAAGGAA